MGAHAHDRFRSRRTVIGLIALSVAVGGYAALNQPSESAAKQETAAKFYSADDFVPPRSDTGYAATIGFGSLVCTQSGDLSGAAGFNADLDLPDGSRITRATFYYQDNDGDADLAFGLSGGFISQEEPGPGHLGPVEEGIPDPVASSGASSDFKSIDVTPVAPREVDNANEDLQLSVLFEECGGIDDDLRLEGARVEYEPN